MKYHLNIDYEVKDWNPDGAYPDNEYVQVYFRLDQRVYAWGQGWTGAVPEDTFYEVAEACFCTVGFKILPGRSSGVCPTAYRGKEHVYLHPMQFSGVVRKTSVKVIAEALQGVDKSIFSCNLVDLYHTVYDMGDYEYAEYLDGQNENIDNMLTALAETKRRDYYKNRWDIIEHVAGEIMLHRIDKTENHEPCSNAKMHVRERVAALIKEGYLIVGLDNDHIRAANKTERKTLSKTA